MTEASYPIVTMASGQVLRLRQIRLVEEPSMTEIIKLRTQAAQVLGPSGTMVGVFGAPSLALAAEAVALNVVSGVLNQVAQKTALEHLRKAQLLASELQHSSIQFSVEEVDDLAVPNPGAWSAIKGTRMQDVNVGAMGKEEKAEFCRAHDVRHGWGDPPEISVTMPLRYIHDGNDFVFATTDEGEVNFRWSQVESYRY